MKFIHVYNEDCFRGLEKNGLINKDTGFKIQHIFSMEDEMKFNSLAKKGGKLHSLLKEGKHPFYVDRFCGGTTYHTYDFDKDLIEEYRNLLGDWFLGFQLHESGSNRRQEWKYIMRGMNGDKGPYDPIALRKAVMTDNVKLPNGELLPILSQDTPEVYATMRYAETYQDFVEEMKDMFRRRMEDVDGLILPCDSYFLATKLQDEMGIKSFMPEVGCQIAMMRIEVALARGIAKGSGKTWGTYYECWREIRENGKMYYAMPCFNTDPSNEWHLPQDQHPDDFSSYGENGGSSRLLQDRIYHYSLMSGADYVAEEWGLNCSYTDMHDFTLSHYGQVKKDFINFALSMQGMKAETPFAIVLPNDYSCIEITDMFTDYRQGHYRDEYLYTPLNASEKEYIGRIEDVLKLIFNRVGEGIGNEGHVITNSPFGDVFDIIYEDASDETLSKYAYLIDASPEGSFAKARKDLKVLESRDLEKLSDELNKLIPAVMPCYVDGLCWLVSYDERGKRYLSIFNNEGNERSLEKGDIIHKEADRTVTISLKEVGNLEIVKEATGSSCLKKVDDKTFQATILAAGFAIFEF